MHVQSYERQCQYEASQPVVSVPAKNFFVWAWRSPWSAEHGENGGAPHVAPSPIGLGNARKRAPSM